MSDEERVVRDGTVTVRLPPADKAALVALAKAVGLQHSNIAASLLTLVIRHAKENKGILPTLGLIQEMLGTDGLTRPDRADVKGPDDGVPLARDNSPS